MQTKDNATPGQDPTTLDMVRRLIDDAAEHPAPEPHQAAPSERKPEPVSQSLPVPERVAQLTPAAGATALPDAETEFDRDQPEDQPWWKRLALRGWRLVARFMQRPDAPRELALALLAVSIILFPGIVAALLVLAIVSAGITWLTLGPDRATELIAGWHARLAARDPAHAETIRRRAARVSATITALVDRLPDSWTTGFSLPDFEPTPETPEKMKDDPFARLAAQARAGEEKEA